MTGSLVTIWPATWRELWAKLGRHPDAPEDIYCELYREMLPFLRDPPEERYQADVLNDTAMARQALRVTKACSFRSEESLVEYLEAAHGALVDLDRTRLSSYYCRLVRQLIGKFNLRYELFEPFMLCPTLPGLFSSLFGELRTISQQDRYLASLMSDFEEALRELRHGRTERRIKTFVHRNFNLLEGLGRSRPEIRQRTLGQICEELRTWPHEKVKEAVKCLYHFASDYPGIRHGGTPANVQREMGVNDLLALGVLLMGSVPYLTEIREPERLYWGG